MRICCLIHLEFETLGNIGEWVNKKDHILSLIKPSEDPVYPHSDEFDLLIIMGGLMSVYQEDEYPWLAREKEFVKSSIESSKAVYGICFGSQMIAEILGGKVSKNHVREIGWHRVFSLDVFRKKTGLFPIQDELILFQWHGDTFSLPPGAVRLFESEACQEQGFIHGDNVVAVQFHPEVDAECIENLLLNCASDLSEGLSVQSESEIRGRADLLRSSSDIMFRILEWFEEKIESDGISNEDHDERSAHEHMRDLCSTRPVVYSDIDHLKKGSTMFLYEAGYPMNDIADALGLEVKEVEKNLKGTGFALDKRKISRFEASLPSNIGDIITIKVPHWADNSEGISLRARVIQCVPRIGSCGLSVELLEDVDSGIPFYGQKKKGEEIVIPLDWYEK